jgi:Transglutaminase-like superfamily/Coenzyme PQQ synthesis protein D (PqqD)
LGKTVWRKQSGGNSLEETVWRKQSGGNSLLEETVWRKQSGGKSLKEKASGKKMKRQEATNTCITSLPGEEPSRLSRYVDGIVLLSVKDDLICKLNSVGALTWLTIEDKEGDPTFDQIVHGLRERIDAVNCEGKYYFEVSDQQLSEDTSRFLDKMVAKRLVTTYPDSLGRNLYQIPEGVLGTTKGATSQDSATAAQKTQSATSSALPEPLKRETITAFIGLTLFDLLLKTSGFESLVEKVKNWPVAKHRTADEITIKRIRAAVDRAQMYYPKKAMCLQHSAVTTCLLRRKGVPAEMVLAAIDFPVKAHAWSEANGRVVNDAQSVKTRYRELTRV